MAKCDFQLPIACNLDFLEPKINQSIKLNSPEISILILNSWSYSHILSKPNNSLPSSSFIFISKRYQSQLKMHKVALDLFNDILGLKLYLSDDLRPPKSSEYVSFRSLTESKSLCFTLEAWELQRGVNSGPGNLSYNWINNRHHTDNKQ